MFAVVSIVIGDDPGSEFETGSTDFSFSSVCDERDQVEEIKLISQQAWLFVIFSNI